MSEFTQCINCYWNCEKDKCVWERDRLQPAPTSAPLPLGEEGYILTNEDAAVISPNDRLNPDYVLPSKTPKKG